MKPFRHKTGKSILTPRRVFMAGAMLFLAAGAVALLAGFSQAGWGKGTPKPAATAAGGGVSTAIEPGRISLGEAAILVVQVSGEGAGPPSLGAVDGLRFHTMGQSSQYQSINGRVSATTSYLFQVQAERPGEFVIPPVQARIAGNIMKSRPVTLHVVGGGSRSAPQSALPSYNQHSRKRAGQDGGRAIKRGEFMSWEQGKPAFLRVLPRAGKAYEGELLPMEIKAYIHQGVQATLRTLPTIQGGAFACRELGGKPVQTEEILDGVPFNVLTWHTAVSAVKEGEHPVTVELDATLGIPEQSRRRSPFGRGFFDDDFFNGFFENIREEQVKLTNPRLKIRILPLPKMGRPANFGGAVGSFKLSASATPKKSMVGDPITVKMRVRGTGNFDRVSTPVLDVGEGWKTYRPSTAFKPASATGYTGEKVFEQAVIPMEGTIKCIPPVRFSYFDTDKKKYVTLKTKAIPLTLTQGNGPSMVSGPSGGTKEETSGTPGMEKDTRKSALAPLRVAAGNGIRSLRPLVEDPWFLGAQGFPVGALFLGLFLSRRQKRHLKDPGIAHKKQVKQKINESIRKMDRAITAHDTAAFFHACRTASQERLGEIWGQPPQGITLAEIKNRLGDSCKSMSIVFEKADAAAYSGQSFGPEELKRLRDLLVCELNDLNRASPASHH